MNLLLDSQYLGGVPDAAWLDQFENRIREVASRAVAHIKRGDWVNVRTTAGESVSGNGSVGADPVLRFLALLEPSPKAPPAPAPRENGTRDSTPALAAVLPAHPLGAGSEVSPKVGVGPRGRA